MNDQPTDASTQTASPCDFSLIVPMRNEEHYVAETLESLIRQDYPPERFEVLVVDGGSTDTSREIVSRIARSHPNVRLLDNPRAIAAAARNVGIRAARGRYIGVVDCHSFVQPDFLATAERIFGETRADCLGRPVELFVPTDSYLQRVIGAARTSWLGHNAVSPRYRAARGATSPLSVGILYHREVFARIGLFNEEFEACEDVEFNARLEQAGMSTWTDPALRVTYHPRGSLWALFKQLRRYAYWRYRLLRAQRRAFHFSQAAPAGAAALAVAAIAAAALGLLPAAVPASLAAAYAGLVGAASLRAGVARGLRYLPLLPFAFFAIHVGAAIGFWAGLLQDARAWVSGITAKPTARARRRSTGSGWGWAQAYADGRSADKGILARGLSMRTQAAVEVLGRCLARDQEFALLDVGTAGGEMLASLCVAFPKVRAVGMDSSFALLSVRRTMAPVVQADAVQLPFKANSFDACLLSAVLKHVKNADLALSEVGRVLKQRGTIVLIDPNPPAIMIGCLVGYFQRRSIAHRFTAGRLCRMLADAGLTVVSVDYVGVETPWRWLNWALTGLLRALRMFAFIPSWLVVVGRREEPVSRSPAASS